MNIAIISHDNKKELAEQFCVAYAAVLAKHELCATGTTGAFLIAHTSLPITQFMNGAQGGMEQIGSRIALGEIDLLLFFADPRWTDFDKDAAYLAQVCARHNVPFAINLATAEALILALDRGDLDWREAMKGNRDLTPNTRDFLCPL